MTAESDAARRLRSLWWEHRHAPFPGARLDQPQLQEVALYATWLGGVVEAALAHGGRLSPALRLMLDVRKAEGNAPLWAAAAEMGEPVRAYVARLLAVQAAVEALPPATDQSQSLR
ncbi:MAG: hypothetical protein M3024_12080 [Candidatus Dormibacteraeota bacterium]|nr:hypothetical protein [Candidatus Dormibacteraeota bacterium]